MARGSLAGIVSGVVVSGVALGVATFSVPQVDMPGAPPAAGVTDPVMAEPEAPDTAPDTAAPAVSPTTADGVPAAEPEPEPAEPAEPDVMPAPADAEPAAEPDTTRDVVRAEDPGAEPDSEPGAATDMGEGMEVGMDADAGPVPDLGAEADPEAAAAADADPQAEPPTGATSPATSPADPAPKPTDAPEKAPLAGEAAETEIAAQPADTPLPETDAAPTMETDPVKVPMAEPEADAGIPGMETAEKLPPALPPGTGAERAPEASEGIVADASAPEEPVADAETVDLPEPVPPMPAEPDAGTGTDNGPDSGSDKATDDGSGNAPDTEPAAEAGPEPAVEPAPEPAADPEAETEIVAAAAPEPEPQPQPQPEQQPEQQPEPVPEIPTIVAEPAPGQAAPAVAPAPAEAPETAPEPGLSGTEAVVTGRLPSIGDVPPEAPAPVVQAPAIERNGLDFAVEGDQPLLALLLLDTGNRDDIGEIGNLPFPVTVAVNAAAPDAAEAIAFYDTRGIEVALVLPLPDAAAPQDVDVTVQAYGPLLDEAAVVVAEASLGFQALGPGASQLGTNLAESGHGLVSFPSGLNTGHKSALKQGVPAGLVFLDLDGEGQGAPVIRRFLDNAAFRARNENGVIVLARTRPETLQALLEWSAGNRAQTVSLAPISTVLLAQ